MAARALGLGLVVLGAATVISQRSENSRQSLGDLPAEGPWAMLFGACWVAVGQA